MTAPGQTGKTEDNYFALLESLYGRPGATMLDSDKIKKKICSNDDDVEEAKS